MGNLEYLGTQQCQSTKETESNTPTTGNHPVASSSLQLPMGSWQKRHCTATFTLAFWHISHINIQKINFFQ